MTQLPTSSSVWHRLFTRCLIMLSLTVAVAAETADEVILLIKRPPANVSAGGASPAPALTAREPQTIEEVWQRWYAMPGQVWLDTPSGRKPLFGFDTVYDANGFPRPRLPDPFTYAVITNPADPAAIRSYLDWRTAVIKRANVVANQMPEHAYAQGILGPKNVEVPRNRPTDAKAVGDMRAIEAGSRGTPLISPGKARELGAQPEEIPSLPGAPGPGGIEVYWFWHHRCEHCVGMAREWFAFQRPLQRAGYKVMSINVSALRSDAEIESASYEVASVLEIWQVTWGEDAEYSSNTLDWNNLGKTLNITGTPTVIYINRNGDVPRIERLEGPQTVATLRAQLAATAGWSPDTWPPPPAHGEAPESTPTPARTDVRITLSKAIAGEQ